MPISQKPRNWKGRNRRRQAWVDAGRPSMRISQPQDSALRVGHDSKVVVMTGPRPGRTTMLEQLRSVFRRAA